MQDTFVQATLTPEPAPAPKLTKSGKQKEIDEVQGEKLTKRGKQKERDLWKQSW